MKKRIPIMILLIVSLLTPAPAQADTAGQTQGQAQQSSYRINIAEALEGFLTHFFS